VLAAEPVELGGPCPQRRAPGLAGHVERVTGRGQFGAGVVGLLGGDVMGVLGVAKRPFGVVDGVEVLADRGDVTPPIPDPGAHGGELAAGGVGVQGSGRRRGVGR
jgi:hypothetical protein